MSKIQQALDNLEKVVRENSASTVVHFSVSINCEGREVRINARRPEQLRAQGISMRNLAGDFIKE